MIKSQYLVIRPGGSMRRGNWLSAADFREADRGRLILINIQTEQRYHRGGTWRDLPTRRNEPRVVLLADRDPEEA